MSINTLLKHYIFFVNLHIGQDIIRHFNMSGETLSLPAAPATAAIDINAVTAVGNPTTLLNGIVQTSSQPSITTLPSVTTLGTNLNLPNGNTSLGANVDVAELYVYNSDVGPTYKSGVTISQLASTGDALLQLNACGTKSAIGIDQSDGYKFKISRSQSLDANPVVTIDPNYVSSVTAVSTWTSRSTSGIDNEWQSICWSPELRLFCAVSRTGTGNRVMTSPDGINWTSRVSAADNLWTSVCWSPELRLFCAVSDTGTGNRVMTSPDGITWTSRTSAADNTWQSVCWSPELRLFCAVSFGGANRVMTSPDGITWTIRTSTGSNWISVCWSPELRLFVTVAQSGTSGNYAATSPDGITWTLRTTPADNSWRSVCWSPELRVFCAVSFSGTGNRVMTSPDGMTWTIRTSAADNGWYSVCWSSDLKIFCAVSNTGTGNRVMTSPDGITWTSRTSAADNSWQGVCWSPELGIFAVVGSSGTGNRAMTSASMYTNPANVIVSGTLINTNANFANTLYPFNGNLAIGANIDRSELYVYNSDSLPTTKSGIVIHQDSTTADAHLQLNAYGTKNTIGIDVSDSYKFKISRGPSVDANPIVTLDPNYSPAATVVSTWTTRTVTGVNQWQSVCWSPELRLFCAVSETGSFNRVMTSPNGITWTRQTTPNNNIWRSVCWASEIRLFVAVSDSGTDNRVMTSSDGITWTAQTSAANNLWKSVCWSPELRLFAAVSIDGTGNRVMTSPDGTTWTLRSTAGVDNLWAAVTWASELRLFCAVSYSGTGNRVMTSPDGIIWTTRASAADNNWISICWSPELRLFAATSSTGTGNRVMTSPNGITWTLRTSAADNAWANICWASELRIFVAVAATGTSRIMTSPDGITWTSRTPSDDTSAWYGVCWSPELGIFAAVSISATAIMTSAGMYVNAPNIICAGIRGKTTGIADAINVVIDSTGQLGTTSSSITKKHDIRDMADFTNRLYSLNPVIFKWKPEICQDQTDQYGLIAERVAEVFPELAVKDPNDVNYLTVAYQNLIPMLLNEIKKLKQDYAELKEEALAL